MRADTNGQMPAASMGFWSIDDGQKNGHRPTMNANWRKRLTEELARQGRDMKEVSLAAGLGPTYVRDALKRGRGGKLSNLEKIAIALGRSRDWLASEQDDDPLPIPISALPNADTPKYQEFPNTKIPVYGHSSAGPSGRFVMNGQKITDVFCPPSLAGIRGAYAVYVYGNSMEPKFEPGETVWLHPYLPLRTGDYVVAQIKSGDEHAPLDAYVKQFISHTSKELVLRQLNPPDGEGELMHFPDETVFSVHKVVFHQLV